MRCCAGATSAPRSTSAIRSAKPAASSAKSSDESEIDLTGTLQIGTTIAPADARRQRHDASIVERALSKSGRRRLRSSIRERAHRRAGLSRDELRRRNAAAAARLRRRTPSSCIGRARGALAQYDAYVLPGGFAYEDRVRAGAIAAHDRMMDFVIEGARARETRARHLQRRADSARGRTRAGHRLARAGRPPRLRATRPQPHFVCRHVYRQARVEPSRGRRLRPRSPHGALVPAWAAHAEGRLAATPEHLRRNRARRPPRFRLRPCRRRAWTMRPSRTGRRSAAPGWSTAKATCSRSCRIPSATAGTSIISTAAMATTCSRPSGGAALFRSFVAGGGSMKRRASRSRSRFPITPPIRRSSRCAGLASHVDRRRAQRDLVLRARRSRRARRAR